MILKPIDQIQPADILELIENAVRESSSLEYKQSLQISDDSKKKEFLADVSSFANSKGGDIIFGIEESKDDSGKNTGIPVRVTPLVGYNSDQLKLMLGQIIRSGISPRMQFQIEEVSGFDEKGQGSVLVIRVPKSLAAPHMVTFKDSSRFYSRTSTGKHLLDVREIRDAFLATESQAERIRQFRIDRISRILAGDTPVPLSSTQHFVLHVIPIGSFLNREVLKLSSQFFAIKDCFVPMGGLNGSRRFNIDGILNWHNREPDAGNGYCQLFIDATTEYVWSKSFVSRWHGDSSAKILGGIDANMLEQHIVKSLRLCNYGFHLVEAQGPFVIMASLLGCKGCWQENEPGHDDNSSPIESDLISLREVVLDNLENNLEINLRPLFDQIWNAFGHLESKSFDAAGNWRSL